MSLAEAQRILDSAARRLLAEQLDRDAAGATARGDKHTGDHGANQPATLRDSQRIPMRGSRDRQRRPEAA